MDGQSLTAGKTAAGAASVDVLRLLRIALGIGVGAAIGAGIGMSLAVFGHQLLIAGGNPGLLQFDWLSSGIGAALALSALVLGTLVIAQNRRLVAAYERLRIAADNLRAAKEAADAASEAKSRFLATMSHELRTPLNAVIGFSEIIAAETFGPVGQAAYREYAGAILQSGQHMLDLINDILTMAKLDAGRYELDFGPVSLRDAADRAVNMFRGSRLADGRTITLGGETDWPWIQADERALRQMLLNLLSNAAKFSEPETPIELCCRRTPVGEIAVTVTDHGIGMTPQEAAEVVLPFHQADSRLARKYDGSGLGLSIVAGLMGCHGGRLEIDSQPGAGSRISLVFPAAARAPSFADVA